MTIEIEPIDKDQNDKLVFLPEKGDDGVYLSIRDEKGNIISSITVDKEELLAAVIACNSIVG